MKNYAIGDGHKRITCPDDFLADDESEDTVVIWDPQEPEMPIRITILTFSHPHKDVSRLAFDRVINGAREKGAEARIAGDKAVHAYQKISSDGHSVNRFHEVGFANHLCLFTLTVPLKRVGSVLMKRIEAELEAMVATLTERAAGVQFSCELMEGDKQLIWEADREVLKFSRDENAWELL